MGEPALGEAIRVAASLRRSGIGVLQALGAKSLKAQLRQANAQGVRYAVIIGEQEMAAGTAVLRNMATAEQKTVPREQLPGLLR